MPNVGGRPTKLTPEMFEKADHYIEHYESEYGHATPSAVGMAVVLNVAKSTLYKWAEDENNGFSDTLAKCNDWQEFTLNDKGLKNEVNPTIAKLALANFGYSDSIDNKHSGLVGTYDLTGKTDEELNAIINGKK